MENLNGIITQIVQISPNMKVIRIAPDGWSIPDFKPGQFVMLGLPESNKKCCEATDDYIEKNENPESDKMIKRAYSIASSNISKDFLEFYITLIHSGELTPRIFNLEIGDRIWVGQRFVGIFTLDAVPSDKNLLLFGTGTGLAPYMSMLRTDALTRKGKIFAMHGASNSWDLGYFSELSLLQNVIPHFNYLPTVIRSEKEYSPWSGETRTFQEIWESGTVKEMMNTELTPENTHVFLCGNPNMVSNMLEILGKEGFTQNTAKNKEGQIHVEEY